MFILTNDCISGYQIKPLELVFASIVNSKGAGKDFMSSLKNMVGGELKSYTEMITEARTIALERLKEQAKLLGADAVISTRFTSSNIVDGTAEVTVYGTAVKLIKSAC
ncbi:YbjQ family protein [Clostridium sp. CM028]|uniref:YbjQ family protein n=1 Tax=unclassified Clostridium TaxID=2614128 RepID=UPI001C6F181D|nr:MULTISPECIES: YbjQ family protein [unclassified Clostridium]MBW9147213.1 YbjQ family protein [Clostridium sp. CM027]MBW9150432.1 YbjQ family protein [Clostridium sp. CM028]UVE42818.1 YbjQ family protein [Clostridium sp. CM027]WLC63493.1 YbjQ family protein [Clostridium sp. CM028]